MIRRISHAQFIALCQYVTQEVEKDGGKPVVLAIADEAGDIVYMSHMDNTPPRSGKIASGKAFTAAKMERTTTALLQFCQDSGTTLDAFVIPGMTTMPGGTPIISKDGEPMGAVGVSGRSAQEDQAMADKCAAFLATL